MLYVRLCKQTKYCGKQLTVSLLGWPRFYVAGPPQRFHYRLIGNYMRYKEKGTRPTTFCVCKTNSTTVILPVPFSNMVANFFTTAIPVYYDIFPYSIHVLWLFYCYPFIHKHYGLDAALRPTVKPCCFLPTTITRLVFFTLL